MFSKYTSTFHTLMLIIGMFGSLSMTWAASPRDQQLKSSEHHQNKGPKAVLVTGASSGIGYRIANTLAQQGYFVYAGARKAADLERLSQLPNMQGIRLDVTIQQDIDAAVETIQQAGRGLYGLVNNAGVFLFDPLIEVSEQDMQFIMDVNVMGPYRVTKAFAPLIIQEQGRITTIGSVAGLFSGQLFGPYGMSKFAVEAYTEALAGEMNKFGVAVSIIEPGNFKSNIMKNMQQRLQRLSQAEQPSLYAEEIKRFAGFTQADRSHHQEPQPVADAVVNFLKTEEPPLRYLVTPNQAEANMTVQRLIKKLVDINAGQVHRISDDDLLQMLRDMLDDES